MSQFCNEVSVRGRRWEARQSSPSDLPETVLRNGYAVPAEVVGVVCGRGVADPASYFEPSLRAAMPDPSSLTDMDRAVDRFCLALERKEKVAVFGDYDVDGATSTAILIRFLRAVGAGDAIFYIPQRLEEGYGPNDAAMDHLKGQGASLVLVVDSGTGAIDPDPAKKYDPIGHARRIGLDVVVLDHHEVRDDGLMPDTVIVNPKRPEDDGSLSYLCTAGLAFLFLVGVNRALRQRGFYEAAGVAEPDLRQLLGLVALGTVADVVPLRGLNRAYVMLGFAMMDRIAGIRALCDATGEREFNVRTCGFVFGPCLNAGGRISDTMQGARLLTTEDPEEARELAERLVEINKERQQMQREMVAQCIAVAEERYKDDAAIVLYDDSWHPGVVGISASKVKDHFDRTAVVIGQGGKGSGRASEGFNIGKAFHQAIAAKLLKKGGGHAAAGGLTAEPALIAELRAFLNEQARGCERPPVKIDMVRPVGQLSYEVIEAFGLLAPFGMGNGRPRVAFTGGVLTGVRIFAKGTVKARLVGPEGTVGLILFGGEGTPFGEAIRAAEGRYVDVVGEVSINTYGGVSEIQIKPEDVMVGAVTAEAAERIDQADAA